MKISVINPNTTEAMTEVIARIAAEAAAPDTEILALTSSSGPESIEGPYDGAVAVPGLLQQMRIAEDAGVAGHVIACFDDTGLDAARSAASVPVIGTGEAAYHVASLIAHSFTVVTTLGRSVPVLERNLSAYGLASRCRRIRASEVSVLELEENPNSACDSIVRQIELALREDGCDAIVLGCAGMTELADDLAERFGVPIIDGVRSAVTLIEALARMKLKTSKFGAYAPPLPKRFIGLAHEFEPKFDL